LYSTGGVVFSSDASPLSFTTGLVEFVGEIESAGWPGVPGVA
jgi:hypothetical protein